MAAIDDPKAIEARRKYVYAFNETMIKIWQDQIILLGVIDTGHLLRNVRGVKMQIHDNKILSVTLEQEFPSYGIWQDYGVGKETPRGNPGDIGHDKVRKRRKWFSRKYYGSVMNINDFFAESLGREFIGVVARALDDRFLKQSLEIPINRSIF